MRRLGSYLLLAGIVLALSAVGVGQQGGSAYVGISNCQMCHKDKYDAWAKTRHSRAFKLLELAGQTTNPQCLSCHVTGYGDGGYQPPTAGESPNADYAAVTCEACHGKGSDHNGDKEKIVRVPPASVCAKCHKDNIHPEEKSG